MATVGVGIKFQLGASPKQFQFTDTTDYAGQSLNIADFNGVIKVIDPTGTISYNNTNYGSPDIDPSVSLTNTTLIPIPLDAQNEPLKGNYTITYSIQDVNTLEVSSVTKTVNFNYVAPEVKITLTVNCVAPLLKSVDNTIYPIGGVTPTIDRTHTLFYPAVLQLSPLVGTGNIIETSTFFTEQHSSKIEADLTYVFPTYTVTDTIEGSETINVECDAMLCDIYCCMAAEFNRYHRNQNKNTVEGNIHFQNWIKMMGLATMIRIALECGKQADINDYVNQILALGECKKGCGCESRFFT